MTNPAFVVWITSFPDLTVVCLVILDNGKNVSNYVIVDPKEKKLKEMNCGKSIHLLWSILLPSKCFTYWNLICEVNTALYLSMCVSIFCFLPLLYSLDLFGKKPLLTQSPRSWLRKKYCLLLPFDYWMNRGRGIDATFILLLADGEWRHLHYTFLCTDIAIQ